MKVYEDLQRVYPEPRAHPWTAGDKDPRFRYVDFKAHPELIRQVLEDFRPFTDRRAIQTFYSFLEWVNGEGSQLETNDCAFRKPAAHQDRNSNNQLCCHGRVFVFYRNVRYNLIEDAFEWLNEEFRAVLSEIDPEFPSSLGVIGLTVQLAHYTSLPFQDPEDILGRQLMFSFWAYGNSEEEAFDNLDRLFHNLWSASKAVSDHIRDKFDHEALESEATQRGTRAGARELS